MLVIGAKYETNRSRVEIARLVRRDIREAVSAGKLPAGRYSVRCGPSKVLYVEAASFSEFVQIFRDERALRPLANLPKGALYTRAAAHILATLEALVAAYTRDDTELVSGRYESNVSPFVSFSQGLLDADRARLSGIPCCPTCGGWARHRHSSQKCTGLGPSFAVETYLAEQAACTGWNPRKVEGWLPPEAVEVDEDFEVLRRTGTGG